MNHSFTKQFLMEIAILVTVVGGAQSVRAQGTTAELQGLVKDPSANVVPGAGVRVQNLDTGLSRTVQSLLYGSYATSGFDLSVGPG